MTKSKIFFVLVLSFLLGAFAASFFEIENYLILILVLAGISIFIINYKNKKAVVAGAATLFLALGAWRTNISLDAARNNLTNQKIGPVEFVGIVSKEPEADEKYQKIIVEDNDKNKILINSDIYPSYKYGNELKINCVLQEPKIYDGSKFDYPMYLAKDGIYRICNRANISILRSQPTTLRVAMRAGNEGNIAYAFILNIKSKFEEKLSAIFPDPEGAYLKGLLLGGSKRMTKDLAEAFQRTGTTHTVAVSGYNVTIVAAFLMWLGIASGLWRQQVFSFALIGIVLFVLMTGAPSSAVRAGIMGALVIWAMKEGRLANSTNAILLAAGAMLAINPLLLRYDAGFQLSFLATIGIVQLSPLLEKFFFRKPARIATLMAKASNILIRWPSKEKITKLEQQSVAGGGRAPKLIQETIILTMSAIIFVLPIILNSFEKLPLVSPIANFVILPAIPYIMGTGFAAGMAGFIFLPLGKLIGFIPYILLKAELFAVEWLGNLPWASVEVKNFGWKYILVYYLVLFWILYYFKKKDKKFIELANEK